MSIASTCVAVDLPVFMTPCCSCPGQMRDNAKLMHADVIAQGFEPCSSRVLISSSPSLRFFFLLVQATAFDRPSPPVWPSAYVIPFVVVRDLNFACLYASSVSSKRPAGGRDVFTGGGFSGGGGGGGGGGVIDTDHSESVSDVPDDRRRAKQHQNNRITRISPRLTPMIIPPTSSRRRPVCSVVTCAEDLRPISTPSICTLVTSAPTDLAHLATV